MRVNAKNTMIISKSKGNNRVQANEERDRRTIRAIKGKHSICKKCRREKRPWKENEDCLRCKWSEYSSDDNIETDSVESASGSSDESDSESDSDSSSSDSQEDKKKKKHKVVSTKKMV